MTRDSHSIRLCIEDSGPGIPREDRERVLDRFYRRPGEHAGGHGLGLAIVREIAARHAARLTLEDSELGGLAVRLEFPAAGRASGVLGTHGASVDPSLA